MADISFEESDEEETEAQKIERMRQNREALYQVTKDSIERCSIRLGGRDDQYCEALYEARWQGMNIIVRYFMR